MWLHRMSVYLLVVNFAEFVHEIPSWAALLLLANPPTNISLSWQTQAENDPA